MDSQSLGGQRYHTPLYRQGNSVCGNLTIIAWFTYPGDGCTCVCVCVCVVLRTESRALHMLGKRSITELYLQPCTVLLSEPEPSPGPLPTAACLSPQTLSITPSCLCIRREIHGDPRRSTEIHGEGTQHCASLHEWLWV
jgi:hypothetical protein